MSVSLTIEADGCERVDLFFNSTTQPSLNKSNSRLFNVGNSSGFNEYQTYVSAPVSYFRIDPCDKKKEVYIKKFIINFKEFEKNIPLEELNSWSCVNCKKTLDNEGQTLTISPVNNNPILYTDSFDKFLTDFEIVNFEQIKKYILLIIGFYLSFPLIFYLAKRTNAYIIILLAIGTTMNFWLIGNFDQYKKIGSPHLIGKEKIISYSHLIGYQSQLESIVMWIFMVFPTLLLILVHLIKALIKRKNEK